MRRKFIFNLFGIAIFVIISFSYPLILNSIALSSESKQLQTRYADIKNQLHKHRSGLPIYIESSDNDHVLSGDVYSIISHPFSSVKNALIDPANWCDISILHLNIKACTYRNHNDIKKLTIYTGRKFYQPPEDAFVLDYQFQVIDNLSNYLNLLLTAEKGPLDTSHYRIVLEAMPVEGNKTFIRFSYTYTYGLITQAAMEGYFATLGSDKVGFSVIQHDENNNPVYINGTRGAIERNSVRYYLAFQAYLDTRTLPEKNRFKKRAQLWYSLTDRFKEQLFELSKEDYLRAKILEQENQLKLQKQSNQESNEFPGKITDH